MGVRISKATYLRTAEDAMHYCLLECQKQKFGCAVGCEIRIHWKIPPHGSRYPKQLNEKSVRVSHEVH